MSFTAMADVPNPIFDANGNPFSGAVLKAYLPGTTTSTSIFIDSAGSSPQQSITANAKGIWEVTGNAITPYIDKKHKWGIFLDAADAANNAPFYMGPFDNVEQSLDALSTINSSLVTYSAGNNFTGGVDRTQEVKNAERVSLKDFGALGDGATDDQPDSKVAVDSGEGALYGTKGDYLYPAPLVIELSDGYAGFGTRILGTAQEVTTFTGDTVTTPNLSSVINAIPTSPNTSGYNFEFSHTLVTCNDSTPANRGVNGIDLGRGPRKQLHDLSFVGFDVNILISDNVWLSRFENISMVRNDTSDSSNYGIKFDAGGTSNWFNQCFVNATDTIAYALRGDYSAIGTMAADNCTGIVYDFNGFNGSACVLGAESAGATTQVNTANTRLIIDSVHFIHVGADDPSTKVFDMSGSDVVVKAGRLGASDGVLANQGQLFDLGSTSFEMGFYVDPDVTFDINPITAGDYDAVLKVNDRFTTGILVNEGGGGRPSIGMDKLAMDTVYGQTDIDYYNATPELQAKQIYLDTVGEPRFDSTSITEVTVTGISGPYTVGELITGATGQGIFESETGSVLSFTRGSVDGAFTGTLTGADSGETSTFSSSADIGKNFATKKGPFRGDTMLEARPDVQPFYAYVVNEDLATTGADETKFNSVQLLVSGTTANRPAALKNNNLHVGFEYFDTTLTRPIWWAGASWVFADGTAA